MKKYIANSISKKVLQKKLRLTINNLHHTLELYSIKPILNKNKINNAILYPQEDLDFLLKKQKELYQYYLENYYTHYEVLELGLYWSYESYKKLTTQEVPHLIRIDKFNLKSKVFLKKEVDKFTEKNEKVNDIYTYTKGKLAEILQFSNNTVGNIIDEYNIPSIPFRGGVRFKESDVLFLLEKQQKLYKTITSNYYAGEDLKKKFKVTPSKFQSYPIPLLARIKELKTLTVYYKKDEVVNILNQSNNFVSLTELKKLLSLRQENVTKALVENHINVIGHPFRKHLKGVTLSDSDKLLKIQTEQYSSYQEMYYPASKKKELGLSNNDLTKMGIPIPALIKIKIFIGEAFVYPKKEVDDLVQERIQELVQQLPNLGKMRDKHQKQSLFELKNIRDNLRDKIKTIFKHTNDPYQAFLNLLDIQRIKFTSNGQLTGKYWNKFVKEKLLTTKASNQTVNNRIISYISITELLVEFTNAKELFSYTAKELNLGIFNQNIYQTYQETIYGFINKVNNSLPYSYIKIENINNPHERARNKRNNKEQKIYSPSQYIELLNYVTDIPLHKELAIKDVEANINSAGTHKCYDSAWLYVLLHMNNGWRSTDVKVFPRIPLYDLSINNIDDFKNKELSNEEAKRIIQMVKVKSTTFIHSKNKKRRHFFCSEELTLPLANAIVICELRVRQTNPISDTLIDFNNERNTMKPVTHKAFFAQYNTDFKFGSLVMNRTFITLMEDVVKKKFNRNSLEILKHIRNHSDIATTNIYVDIPKEHFDFISKQLFDLGYFGYTYDAMATILLEGNVDNQEERTRNSLHVKEVFGDIYKLETLAGYINLIEKERYSIKQYLENLNEMELREKFDLVNLGLLPSKEENYQCIYGKCIFEERDCNKCPLSIPHFYAISQICKRVSKTIKSFEILFTNTSYEGEKTRLANLLYSDLLLLKSAKDRFGEQVIDDFIVDEFNDYQTLISAIRSLPNPSDYITIKRK
ncbi:hypothetical protein [Bacillus sp. FJAT-29937]|uniref:hypothetical protein n=1 Tax=Bacillus sp. FJAT-29937 TaxID=1720553 RepID=UPI00082D623D|nr:hypothetical protein [Bacillus sp. FJAT-29937]